MYWLVFEDKNSFFHLLSSMDCLPAEPYTIVDSSQVSHSCTVTHMCICRTVEFIERLQFLTKVFCILLLNVSRMNRFAQSLVTHSMCMLYFHSKIKNEETFKRSTPTAMLHNFGPLTGFANCIFMSFTVFSSAKVLPHSQLNSSSLKKH